MKITPRENDFHAGSRFAHSTIPKEKWGLFVVYQNSNTELTQGIATKLREKISDPNIAKEGINNTTNSLDKLE